MRRAARNQHGYRHEHSAQPEPLHRVFRADACCSSARRACRRFHRLLAFGCLPMAPRRIREGARNRQSRLFADYCGLDGRVCGNGRRRRRRNMSTPFRCGSTLRRRSLPSPQRSGSRAGLRRGRAVVPHHLPIRATRHEPAATASPAAFAALTRTKRTGSARPRKVALSSVKWRPAKASRDSGSVSTACEMITSPPLH